METNKKMKRVLEVVNIETDEVATAMDVTDKTERQIERITSGLLRQMNTERFFVRDSGDNEGDNEGERDE